MPPVRQAVRKFLKKILKLNVVRDGEVSMELLRGVLIYFKMNDICKKDNAITIIFHTQELISEVPYYTSSVQIGK